MTLTLSSEEADRARRLRPFYFIVVVWGERYVDALLAFCVRTLLAPGNLPALLNKGNRLVVVTTPEDWARILESPVCAVLKRYAEPTYVELPARIAGSSVYDQMSAGHRAGTRRAYADKAYGVLLTPDLMLSDGSVATLQARAVRGAEVVLAAALRYGEEPLSAELALSLSDARPADASGLAISSRRMTRAAIRALHSETMRFEWDASYFTPFFTGLPGGCWWRTPDGDGLLLHTLSWAPVLVDYGALRRHDESTMEHWAIDGDYVYRNFGANGKIDVIRDSDEFMLVSWTPLAVGALPLKRRLLFCVPVLGPFLKGCLLRDAVLGPLSDPLKVRIFREPVYFRAGEHHDGCRATEARAQEILRRFVFYSGRPLRAIAMTVIGMSYRAFAVLAGRWRNRRHVRKMLRRALGGDPVARDLLRRRIKLYARQLFGRAADGKDG